MRVVFFGDSLTEGAVGPSYLPLLRERVAADARLRGMELINAGVGGDTVLNLVRRVDRDVVPHAPDVVVVFIGVNDCTTTLVRWSLPTPRTLRIWRYFSGRKGVRGAITPKRFTSGLRNVVDSVRAHSGARVVLCTPVAHGESRRARSWRLLGAYVAAVRRVGAERGCPIVDLHAAALRTLAEGAARRRRRILPAWWRAWRARHADIEQQARARGYLLTYDGIHLTGRGAALVADVLHEWLATEAGSVAAQPTNAHIQPNDSGVLQ